MNNTTSIPPYYQQLHPFANTNAEAYYPPTRLPAEQSTENSADNANFYDHFPAELKAPRNIPAGTRQQQLQLRRQQHIDGTLLEAVTSAAGEQVALDQLRNGSEEHHLQPFPQTLDTDGQRRTAEQAVSLLPALTSASAAAGKRKRASASPQGGDAVQAGKDSSLRFKNYGPRKRRKQDSPAPDGTIAEITAATPANENDESFVSGAVSTSDGEDTSFFVNEYPPSSTLTDARAAGVYSAAALFRKPSSTSKKYTRPPMSKLFSSLQLAPENFIRLQALAKAYMLNPAFPDRQSCVGNRGKGETDMVKLRLFNCVKEFLDEDGVGARFFGPGSEGRDARAWEWPRDVNRAVSLCTPLLRRMVTNERQRQYAIETRKGAAVEPDLPSGNSKKAGGDEDHAAGDDAVPNASQLEPLLAAFGNDKLTDTGTGTGTGTGDKPIPTQSRTFLLQPPVSNPPLTLRFCVVRTDAQTGRQHLLGHHDVVGGSCRDFDTVTGVVAAATSLSLSAGAEVGDGRGAVAGADGREVAVVSSLPMPMPRVSVGLAGGLVGVGDAEGWRRVMAEVEGTVWMEGVVRVVVEVG